MLAAHLSEGTNLAAHKHFEALHVAGDEWAVARSLVYDYNAGGNACGQPIEFTR